MVQRSRRGISKGEDGAAKEGSHGGDAAGASACQQAGVRQPRRGVAQHHACDAPAPRVHPCRPEAVEAPPAGNAPPRPVRRRCAGRGDGLRHAPERRALQHAGCDRAEARDHAEGVPCCGEERRLQRPC